MWLFMSNEGKQDHHWQTRLFLYIYFKGWCQIVFDGKLNKQPFFVSSMALTLMINTLNYWKRVGLDFYSTEIILTHGQEKIG